MEPARPRNQKEGTLMATHLHYTLSSAIQDIESSIASLPDHIQALALAAAVGAAKAVSQQANERTAVDLPPLTERASLILDTLRLLPPEQVMSSSKLAKELRLLRRPCDASDIRRKYIPELVPYGIERTPRGYRIRPSARADK